MIEQLKFLNNEYEVENKEYDKNIKQQKDFYVKNIERVKYDGKPYLDDMIILDQNNDAV